MEALLSLSVVFTVSDARVGGIVVCGQYDLDEGCMESRVDGRRARWVQYGFAVLGTALLVFALAAWMFRRQYMPRKVRQAGAR